jgi:hypothetical protein
MRDQRIHHHAHARQWPRRCGSARWWMPACHAGRTCRRRPAAIAAAHRQCWQHDAKARFGRRDQQLRLIADQRHLRLHLHGAGVGACSVQRVAGAVSRPACARSCSGVSTAGAAAR